jgi:uracil-DNA glycosylase
MTASQAPRLPLQSLLQEVRACRLCAAHLPLGPRPVLQADDRARILVVGQAPGVKVHNTGIPFNDASGIRLRAWMGIDAETFYDARRIALVPMAFCYPGRSRSGDMAPRPECAATWRARILAGMPHIELTLALGQYAQAWHLGSARKATLAETVMDWRRYWPRMVPLPHPSPRNNRWLQRNAWMERELLPLLQERIRQILESPSAGGAGADPLTPSPLPEGEGRSRSRELPSPAKRERGRG